MGQTTKYKNPVVRQTVFWVSGQVGINQASQLQRLAKGLNFVRNKMYHTIKMVKNKGTDQTVQMCRLICCFVVCKYLTQVFLPISKALFSHF